MLVNRKSEETIAREVFRELSWEDFDVIGGIQHPSEMIEYHSSVGRHIRNKYQLWDRGHVPEIINGVDVSPNHPDAISQRILERVWVLVHEF